ATALYFSGGPESLSPVASGFQQKAAFYFEALSPTSGRQIALLAVPLEAKPGIHDVTVSWIESGQSASESLKIKVGKRSGAVKKLALPKRAVKAALSLVKDKRLISRALESVGGAPLWRGSFLMPIKAE